MCTKLGIGSKRIAKSSYRGGKLQGSLLIKGAYGGKLGDVSDSKDRKTKTKTKKVGSVVGS